MYYFWNTDRTFVAAAFLAVIVTMLTSVVSYTKTIFKLQQNQVQVQDVQQGQPKGEISRDIARYKKTISSIASLRAMFLRCPVQL